MTNVERQEFGPGDALAALLGVIFILVGVHSLLSPTVALFAGLAFPLAAVMVAVLRDRSLTNVLSPGRVSRSLVAWTMLGSAGMVLLITGLISSLQRSLPRDSQPQLDELTKFMLGRTPALAILVIVVLAPVCEEVFFRGAMLKGIRAAWGVVTGMLLSTALFAAWHYSPPRMIVTFVLGLWFGWLSLVAGGLAMPIIAHAVNNAAFLALLYLGVEPMPSIVAVPGILLAIVAAWGIKRSVPLTSAPEAVKS